MNIVIAGIKRSGSTVQFNLVRLALIEAGHSVSTQTYGSGTNIYKTHPFRRDLAEHADFILLTDRDNKDIQASLDRFYLSKDEYKPLKVMRGWLNRWKQYPHLIQSYYLWESDPLEFTKQIIEYTGLDVNPEIVLNKFNKIEPPKKGYDPETFLFHNHITHV